MAEHRIKMTVTTLQDNATSIPIYGKQVLVGIDIVLRGTSSSGVSITQSAQLSFSPVYSTTDQDINVITELDNYTGLVAATVVNAQASKFVNLADNPVVLQDGTRLYLNTAGVCNVSRSTMILHFL